MAVLRVYRDISFLDLQTVIFKVMPQYLKVEGRISEQKKSAILTVHVVDGVHHSVCLPHDLDHPLFTPIVDKLPSPISFCFYFVFDVSPLAERGHCAGLEVDQPTSK
jgi:hypothetical protein